MALSQIEQDNERFMQRLQMIDEYHAARRAEQEAAEEAERQKQQRQDQAHITALEKMRQDRLTREALEGLTLEERAKFDSQFGKVATLLRLTEIAKREADARFEKIELDWQWSELENWKKSLGVNPNTAGRAQTEKIFELSDISNKRQSARLENRKRRELEAEAHRDASERILSGLTQEEVEIVHRLLREEPTTIDRVQEFLANERKPINEIADVSSPRELYRLAAYQMAGPEREQKIPPTSQVGEIESSRTLYAMHIRDSVNKQSKKQR